MKENMFDVLIYLFENYLNNNESNLAGFVNNIADELEGAGFELNEIVKAFEWLEGLQDTQDDLHSTHERQQPTIRIYSEDEIAKLDPNCRGFLTFLEQEGLISTYLREVIINRALALETKRVDIEQLKWITLIVLCHNGASNIVIERMEDAILIDSGSEIIH